MGFAELVEGLGSRSKTRYVGCSRALGNCCCWVVHGFAGCRIVHLRLSSLCRDKILGPCRAGRPGHISGLCPAAILHSAVPGFRWTSLGDGHGSGKFRRAAISSTNLMRKVLPAFLGTSAMAPTRRSTSILEGRCAL